MRKWSDRSQAVYDQLDERLQRVLDRVLDEVADISLTTGFRDQQTQDTKFAEDKSKVKWPNSRHNIYPAIAVDFQPYPYPKREPKLWGALGYVAGRAVEIAKQEGVTLRWGGDWNGNGDLTDQTFDDLFHLEIKE